MDDIVVPYHLAVRLEAYGFPQKTAFCWVEGWDEPQYQKALAGVRGYWAAPTAQEIANQLPRSITDPRNRKTRYLITQRSRTRWSARFEALHGAKGNTLAEALANLWIKLEEPKWTQTAR